MENFILFYSNFVSAFYSMACSLSVQIILLHPISQHHLLIFYLEIKHRITRIIKKKADFLIFSI